MNQGQMIFRKYPLLSQETQVGDGVTIRRVPMPSGASHLHVADFTGEPVLYALVSAEAPQVYRKILELRLNEPTNRHLGQFLCVLHHFEQHVMIRSTAYFDLGEENAEPSKPESSGLDARSRSADFSPFLKGVGD